MKRTNRRYFAICMILLTAFFSCAVSGCSSSGFIGSISDEENAVKDDFSGYLVAVEDEPDTVDFQETTIHYTVATNVFDRLVEMESDGDDHVLIVPSLAESWKVSEDGRIYSFHLRDGVKFSNGSPLTSSDVLYSFTRLLTNPNSHNQDLAEPILGAEELENGAADTLAGFEVTGDLDFTITLTEPFEAFLACLSTPGASIMDKETTEMAEDRFGTDPEYTIGTGSFILWKIEPKEGMLLKANPDCWKGAPKCEGLDLRFLDDPEEIRLMFENGEIDILDLDEIGESAEYILRGDVYQERLYKVPRIAITYIALNESMEPFQDVRVRKALQLGLNREILLKAVYNGLGVVENGIYPHGLYGFNEDLPEIPYDPDTAKTLLAEAGYPEGFDFTISVNASATQREVTLLKLVADFWKKIGVNAELRILNENEFFSLRMSGQLAAYSATWTADYNDPDNFIYTFFGTPANTAFRSLCYSREEAMERVRKARTIVNPVDRLREYRELERLIIQEDAAWVPLFSRLRVYAVSERVEGMGYTWNGSVKNVYCNITIKE